MPLSEPDKDWFQIVDLDTRNLYGYVDMVMWDDQMLMVPMPDKLHWLEPISIDFDKKELQVHIWKYTDNEKNIERVTVCVKCGTLVSASCSKKHKLCPDCHDFKELASHV